MNTVRVRRGLYPIPSPCNRYGFNRQTSSKSNLELAKPIAWFIDTLSRRVSIIIIIIIIVLVLVLILIFRTRLSIDSSIGYFQICYRKRKKDCYRLDTSYFSNSLYHLILWVDSRTSWTSYLAFISHALHANVKNPFLSNVGNSHPITTLPCSTSQPLQQDFAIYQSTSVLITHLDIMKRIPKLHLPIRICHSHNRSSQPFSIPKP